jgi:subtilisin family serine protease
VKVAVVDSGIDAGDAAFAGEIAGGRSFVGGSWKEDTDGHGTFVAGIIAANPSGGVGSAGIAFNAKLLIAKVVDSYGVIPPGAEANAIRWAANEGARVINLSLGGQRDPNDPELDTYSRSERDAIEYAYAKGAVIVAAVGNGTNAPTQPWPYADYPAALPNVLGVAALNQNGSVPSFSNRDPQFVDLAAPGAGIFSTIPRNLEDTTENPGCAGDAYSNCGPAEFKIGDGTSFAAPQVAAAAALLFGVDPQLSPDQVDWILERSATDMTPANGCAVCRTGRDDATGWGRLDVARAVAWLSDGTALPPPDTLEPDDDTGSEAHPLPALPILVTSSEDYWDDPADVFSLRLRAGQTLFATLSGVDEKAMALRLWRPETPDLEGAPTSDIEARSSPEPGFQRLSYRAPRAGVYSLEVLDRTPSRQRRVYQLSLSATGASPQA